MANIEVTIDDEIRRIFETALNEHGYGFQYSVLQAISDLWGRSSSWLPEVTEFPVALGPGTRIDIILQRHKIMGSSSYARDEKDLVLMLAECKRANPAFANWCFAKSPYSYRGSSSEEFLQVERVMKHNKSHVYGDCVTSNAARLNLIPSAYHIAVEVKVPNAKGDMMIGKTGQGAVEDAASQICRGMNGTVNFLSQYPNLFTETNQAFLVPVIFTTARLWVSEVDLKQANLQTGQIDFTDHVFKEVPWLYYQYHLSPAIKHSQSPPPDNAKDLRDVLQAEYIRTVPIVSATGINEFVRQASSFEFDMHY